MIFSSEIRALTVCLALQARSPSCSVTSKIATPSPTPSLTWLAYERSGIGDSSTR